MPSFQICWYFATKHTRAKQIQIHIFTNIYNTEWEWSSWSRNQLLTFEIVCGPTYTIPAIIKIKNIEIWNNHGQTILQNRKIDNKKIAYYVDW